MRKLIPIILTAVLLLSAGCANQTEPPLTVDASAASTGEEKIETDETEPAVYSNITILVRRNAETVSERSITSEEETRMVQEIIFDYMGKSAAWEGIEVSELEDYIVLSFDWTTDSERQNYYQFEMEGKPVLQAGEAGRYTVMSDGSYAKLLQLAGLATEGTITVEEATAKLIERFGEKDADTGNTFSFGYTETVTVDGKEYYRFRISWLVDNEHMSYLTDYLVATDGSEMKEYIPEEPGA